MTVTRAPNIYGPITEICVALGLDPNMVQRLEIPAHGPVKATVFKRDADGSKYVDSETNLPAVEVFEFPVSMS